MSIGERLKEERKEINLTQEQLGNRVNLSKANISKYEKDQLEPNIETLKAFAQLFDCSVDYLLGNSNNKSSNTLTKAFHPLTKDGLTDEDILKIEEYAELLRLKHKK